MKRTDRIATRYGNWVANTRLPQWSYIRRIARNNPRDYAVYAFWNVVIPGIIRNIRISVLRKEITRLRAENERLKNIQVADLLTSFTDMMSTRTPTVKDKL